MDDVKVAILTQHDFTQHRHELLGLAATVKILRHQTSSFVHLLLAIIIGILMLGRILRGRLAGFGFMAEVTGYWWYYTVLSALLLWIVSILL